VKNGQAIEDFYMRSSRAINETLTQVDHDMAKAEERLKLAKRILAKPEALKYALPEAKGMLIYQLMRHSYADAVVGGAVAGDQYLGPQRQAVLDLIWSAMARDELKNVIQHISREGTKLDDTALHDVKRQLRDFFRTEAVHDIDVPFYESIYLKQFDNILDKLKFKGDFDAWYQTFEDHLMEHVPHGYVLPDARSAQYELLRDAPDHPLYASSGWNAYYREA
jgi:hypothetical protein